MKQLDGQMIHNGFKSFENASPDWQIWMEERASEYSNNRDWPVTILSRDALALFGNDDVQTANLFWKRAYLIFKQQNLDVKQDQLGEVDE